MRLNRDVAERDRKQRGYGKRHKVSQNIFLNRSGNGIRVSGDAFTNDPNERWATLKLTPLDPEGYGDYHNAIELFLDEKTIWQLNKLTGELIAQFENPEAPEQD